jgi:adenylosuccinate synthase
MGQTRLNPERKKNAIMCVKTLPSREGSGDFGKVRRLTPQEIEDRHIGQKSSIDGEVRKIGAGIDFDLLKQTVKVNGPSEVALTFCDHWDPEMKNITDKNHITSKIKDLVKQIEHEILVPVTILETGKVFGSIIDLSDKNIDFKSVIHGAVPINN